MAFGEWEVNDPSSAESFTVIFNKARNERKSGAKLGSPLKIDTTKFNHHTQAVLGKFHYAVIPSTFGGFDKTLKPGSNSCLRKNGFVA